MKTMTNDECAELWMAADAAGKVAANEVNVTPMVVGTPTAPFGNEIDYKKKVHFVADGVCGFAWVNLKPSNCKFAKWLQEMGFARPDGYYGGVTISVLDYNQSLTRKAAYAGAFAGVLAAAGFKKVYAYSRID